MKQNQKDQSEHAIFVSLGLFVPFIFHLFPLHYKNTEASWNLIALYRDGSLNGGLTL